MSQPELVVSTQPAELLLESPIGHTSTSQAELFVGTQSTPLLQETSSPHSDTFSAFEESAPAVNLSSTAKGDGASAFLSPDQVHAKERTPASEGYSDFEDASLVPEGLQTSGLDAAPLSSGSANTPCRPAQLLERGSSAGSDTFSAFEDATPQARHTSMMQECLHEDESAACRDEAMLVTAQNSAIPGKDPFSAFEELVYSPAASPSTPYIDTADAHSVGDGGSDMSAGSEPDARPESLKSADGDRSPGPGAALTNANEDTYDDFEESMG